MASSSYVSTLESANLERICRVLNGPCTKQLREVLRNRVPPHTFYHVVKQQRAKLGTLSATQKELILPRTGQYTGNYSDMDISLLYKILRNICNIQPHRNGWGKSAEDTDSSLSACIERIREIRNRTVHSSSTLLSHVNFIDYWSSIKMSVKYIDTYLKNGNTYVNQVDLILKESMQRVEPYLYERNRKYQNYSRKRKMVSNSGNGERKRVKMHRQNVPDFNNLRGKIRSINESEADKIQILPFKRDDTIEVEKIYVQISIVDEYEKRNITTTNESEVSNLTPEKIFHAQLGKPARFVFMLGEAGYGKTVQCQRIAKSWCEAWLHESKEVKEIPHFASDMEKCLKEFEFLFFVQMRDVSNKHVSLIKIIQDVYSQYHLSKDSLKNIKRILTHNHIKSLVLLDGLDDWNISEDKREHLLDKWIPNCRDMPACTILISMRSWKFIDVEVICRRKLDIVIRLNGLNEDSMKRLTTNILCNYIKINRESDEFRQRYQSVLKTISSVSFELKSLMKIPLLAVFSVLTLYEEVETGYSLTTFYLSMVEALIKRSVEKQQTEVKQTTFCQTETTFPSKLEEYALITLHLPQLLKLGKIAFENLVSEYSSLVFCTSRLNTQIDNEDLDLYLRTGLLIEDTPSSNELRKFHQHNIRISFLHKTIQEFLAALYIFYGKRDIIKSVSAEVKTIAKVLKFSYVLTFLSGLSPGVGCKISSLIKELASKDKDICNYRDHFEAESYQKVFYLYNLQLRCYREVRGTKSIKTFENIGRNPKFSFTDIIVIANDSEKVTIRESAEVLEFHANSIISLNVVGISHEKEDGITNGEIKHFLDKSLSLESLYIDGYMNGYCRLFNNYSQRMSRLRTLGLANVAFKGNSLEDLLLKKKSTENISALGLLYLKSADYLRVDFEYRMPSIHWISTGRSGFVRKTRSLSTKSGRRPKLERRNRLFTDFFEILPEYKQLSTLYITYMEAETDRQTFRKVLPELRKLKTLHHIGYRGSSIYPIPDYEYDAEIITMIMQMRKLRRIHLREIHLEKNILSFGFMTKLERIWLGMFEMNSPRDWEDFLLSLSKIKTLERVTLYDTNIGAEVLDKFKSKSSRNLNILNIESTSW